jgi:uncharacterized protein
MSATQILDDAAELLNSLYGRELDRICVERIIVGVFFTGMKLSNGSGGIAYTPPESIQRAGMRILKGERPMIRGMKAGDLIAHGASGPFSDIIRLAAINALSVPFLNDGSDNAIEGSDVTDHLELFRDKKVCMVGAIVPTLKRLQELGVNNVAIIDKKKATKDEFGFGEYLPIEKTAEALGACETAVFTGASIANGSIDYLISCASKDAAIVVVGPTAGFIPALLFRRNVAMISTAIVDDADAALDLLAEGCGAYHLFKQCLRKITLINPARIHQESSENVQIGTK